MTLYYPPFQENSAVDTNGVLLFDGNGSRKRLIIQAAAANTALIRIYLLLPGATTPTTESFLELDALGLFDPPVDAVPSNPVFLKSASGTQTIHYTEV